MTKETIIEIVGIAMTILALAIILPMWFKVKREWRKEDEEFKRQDASQNKGSAAV